MFMPGSWNQRKQLQVLFFSVFDSNEISKKNNENKYIQQKCQ